MFYVFALLWKTHIRNHLHRGPNRRCIGAFRNELGQPGGSGGMIGNFAVCALDPAPETFLRPVICLTCQLKLGIDIIPARCVPDVEGSLGSPFWGWMLAFEALQRIVEDEAPKAHCRYFGWKPPWRRRLPVAVFAWAITITHWTVVQYDRARATVHRDSQYWGRGIAPQVRIVSSPVICEGLMTVWQTSVNIIDRGALSTKTGDRWRRCCALHLCERQPALAYIRKSRQDRGSRPLNYRMKERDDCRASREGVGSSSTPET